MEVLPLSRSVGENLGKIENLLSDLPLNLKFNRIHLTQVILRVYVVYDKRSYMYLHMKLNRMMFLSIREQKPLIPLRVSKKRLQF